MRRFKALQLLTVLNIVFLTRGQIFSLPRLPDAKPLVVLPDHLKDKDDSIDSLKTEIADGFNQNLKINPESYNEAAAIKSSIKTAQSQKAVNHEALKALGGSKTKSGSKLIGTQNQDFVAAKEPTNVLNENIFTRKEHYGATGELYKDKIFNGTQNVWHSSVMANGQYFRDVLTLKTVKVNVNFEIGGEHQIKMWKGFRKWSSKNENTMIAMTNTGILLVREADGNYDILKDVRLPSSPAYVERFEKWDDEAHAFTGIAIAVVSGQLFWYETKGEYKNLENVWRWDTHKNITKIDYFHYKGTDFLIMITNGNSSTADIYEFNYEKKMFWIAQIIHLKTSCNSIAILNTVDDLLICFPQKDEILVYHYEETVLEHQRLQHKESLSAKNVTMIAGFQVGGYSYLAIGGAESRILRYLYGNFEEQMIENELLIDVIYWWPIPIRTFRDDFLLLAHRIIDFGTHKGSGIKGVLWTGETFKVSHNIPCFDDEEDTTMGLSCILDLKRKEGLWGAAYVQNKDSITLVVPQNHAPSALYDVFYDITSAPDPIVESLNEIENLYELLAEIVEHQENVIKNAVEAITYALKPYEDNYISGAWDIAQLKVPQVILNETVSLVNDKITFGEKNWSKYEDNLDLNTLNSYFEKCESQMNMILSDIKPKRNFRESDIYKLEALVNGNLNMQTLFLNHSPGYERQHLSQTYRRKRNVFSPLQYDKLQLQDLHVKSINGIPASELIFSDGHEIELNGNSIIKSVVSVNQIHFLENGFVNGRDIDKQFVHFSSNEMPSHSLVFEHLEATHGIEFQDINPYESTNTFKSSETDILHVKTLEINGDLQVENVNGHNWETFMSQVTLKQYPGSFDRLKVDGKIFVDGTNADIVYVNDINFNNDLVFSTTPHEYIRITGAKRFNNGLFAEQIDCSTVDGIYTPDAVSLHAYQNIPGNTIFNHLDVLNDLEVDGQVEGKKFDEFQKNINLIESRIIYSSAIFENLRVDGPIKITDTLNNINLETALSNVIYTDTKNVQVDSYKFIETGTFIEGIHISAGLLNGININEIATKSTVQIFEFQEIAGDVYIQSLELAGLYDNVNVTELNLQTIKIFGDQYTESELIIDALEIHANALRIESTLNGIGIEDVYRIDELIHLEQELIFNEMIVEEANVHGDVITFNYLNGISLDEFNDIRLSISKPQVIYQALIGHGHVYNNLKNEIINGYATTSFTDNILKSQSVRNLLYSGEIAIDNLHVEKNVVLKEVNGVDLNHVIDNIIVLNRPSSMYGDLKFEKVTYVTGDVTYDGLINGHVMEDFTNNLVSKHSETVNISGLKTFTNTFHVTENIDTKYINDISTSDIVKKDGSVYIYGDMILYGNLVTTMLNAHMLNNVTINQLKSMYTYDLRYGIHEISTVTNIQDPANIAQLIVKGPFNQFHNLSEYFNVIIRQDRDCNVTAPKIFYNTALFDQGLDVHSLNSVLFSNFVKEMVMINNPDTTNIIGLVKFLQPVSTPSIHIQNDLATHNIADCSPQEWAYNSILINAHEIIDSLSFHADTIECPQFITVNLNGRPMEDLMSLNSSQSLKINQLYIKNPVAVGGTVNGVILIKERDNTLLVHGPPQHIGTYNTAFQSLRVLQNLTMTNLNGVNTDNIATLKSNTCLASPLEFTQIKAEALQTQDSISGINFNFWFDNSVHTVSSLPQKVLGEWNIDHLYLDSSISGNGVINNLDVNEIVQSIEKSINLTGEAILGVQQDYRQMCQDVKDLSKESEIGLYIFKYFEEKIQIFSKEKINSVHSIEMRSNKQYVLINSGCKTIVYQWIDGQMRFEKIDELMTGLVKTVLPLQKSEDIELFAILSEKLQHECSSVGIHLFEISSRGEIALALSEPHAIQSIHASKRSDSFYGLVNNSRVIEFDLSLNHIENWHLPETTGSYRFLPSELGHELALSDGKIIVSLTKLHSTGHRFGRSLSFLKPIIPQEIGNKLENTLRGEFQHGEGVQYGEGNSDEAIAELNFEARHHQDTEKSIASKYLVNPVDVVLTNLETHSRGKPNLQEDSEIEYANKVRNEAALVNTKIQVLKNVIKSTTEYSLTNSEMFSDVSIIKREEHKLTTNTVQEQEKGGDSLSITTEVTVTSENPKTSTLIASTMVESSEIEKNEDKVRSEDQSGFMNQFGSTVSKWYGKAVQYFNDITEDPNHVQEEGINNLETIENRSYSEEIRGEIDKWYKLFNTFAELATDVINLQKADEFNPVVSKSSNSKNQKIEYSLSSKPNFMKDLNDNLVKLVKKWDGLFQKGRSAFKSIINAEREEPEEPVVTQTRDLQQLLTKLPELQSMDEQQFSQQIRDLVTKWNTKVYELKENLDLLPNYKTSELNTPATKTKILEDMILDQFVENSKSDYPFKTEITLWKIQSDELMDGISKTPIPTDFDQILRKKRAIDEIISNLLKVKVFVTSDLHSELKTRFKRLIDQTNQLNKMLKKENLLQATITSRSVEIDDTKVEKPSFFSTTTEKVLNDTMLKQTERWNQFKEQLKKVKTPIVNSNTDYEPIHKDFSPVKNHNEKVSQLKQISQPPRIDTSGVSSRPLPNGLIINPAGVPVKPKSGNEDSIELETDIVTERPQITSTNNDEDISQRQSTQFILFGKTKRPLPSNLLINSAGVIYSPSLKNNSFISTNFKQSVTNESILMIDHQESISGNKKKVNTIVPTSTIPMNQFTAKTSEQVVTPAYGDFEWRRSEIVSKLPPNVLSTTEPTVGNVILDGGVKYTENPYLPGRGKSEVVVMNVGIRNSQRTLIAASVIVDKKSTAPEQHDFIQIYEDIFEGKVFQTLPCYQPSGLSVIHLRDETLLAFLEGKATVKIYTYRGIQGFVLASSFNLPKPATSMHSLQLSQDANNVYHCTTNYLAVASEFVVTLYEAKTEPKKVCKIKANLNCD